MTATHYCKAKGYCSTCNTVHVLGEGGSRPYAIELMRELEVRRCIDSGVDPKCSTDPLWSDARGQMFGVMECVDATGASVVLRAFSGQFNGLWLVDGWVPPIIDAGEFFRITDPVDRQIKQLDQEIRAAPAARELIRRRKSLSQHLMKELHGAYHLTNFQGETRPLTEVFAGGIPTGVGDCCAPKLLHYAAKKGLIPLGISEFYWGRENRSGTRQHGQFYSACAEKCQPILGFMLCGLAPAIQIVYQDSDVVVVNKPSGLLAVPGKGAENQDCVVRRIQALFPDCIAQPAVHRLDMDTSGLMMLALTAERHRELSRQFEDRQVEKRYIALLDGEVSGDSGTIELPFRLDVDHRPYQIYDPVFGKMGTTHWKKLAMQNGQTRVEMNPITGRTHQLRLHAASEHGLGAPIVGDCLYGSGTAHGELKLHASYLSFTHPCTGQRITLQSTPAF